MTGLAMEVATPAPRVGPLLREWRQRRQMSQLDLALEAGVSARHVSFVETGRSRPSPEMVLQLAAQSRCATATSCFSRPATRPFTGSAGSRSPR
jgi:transcriptional regulator with XRE-family HTH domain